MGVERCIGQNCVTSILNTKRKMKSAAGQIIARTLSAMTLMSCGFYSRAFILFLAGSSLATLKLLPYVGSESNIGLTFELKDIINFGWCTPAIAGVFACIIGLLYPCLDSKLGEPHYFRRDWNSVVRCIVVFVGINHFSTVSFF